MISATVGTGADVCGGLTGTGFRGNGGMIAGIATTMRLTAGLTILCATVTILLTKVAGLKLGMNDRNGAGAGFEGPDEKPTVVLRNAAPNPLTFDTLLGCPREDNGFEDGILPAVGNPKFDWLIGAKTL
jgi:hypothetical protein